MTQLLDRPTVSELETLYQLEPTIRDVYVEGPTDRAIIGYFLRDHGLHDVGVREVETVDMSDLLEERGTGNKERVIALARALEASGLIGLRQRVVCIVDADLERVLQRLPELELLVVTDFVSLDLYVWDPRIIQRFLDVVWLGIPYTADELLANIADPLRFLFAVRLVNHLHGHHLPRLSPEKLLKHSGVKLDFDRELYVSRFLNHGLTPEQRDAFAKAVRTFLAAAPSDARHFADGDDFFQVFLWFLRSVKGPKGALDQLFLRRSVFGCIDSRILAEHGLFQELLNRLA